MTGDRVGCGVKFENISGLNVSLIPVFFTKNGKEVIAFTFINQIVNISPPPQQKKFQLRREYCNIQQ